MVSYADKRVMSDLVPMSVRFARVDPEARRQRFHARRTGTRRCRGAGGVRSGRRQPGRGRSYALGRGGSGCGPGTQVTVPAFAYFWGEDAFGLEHAARPVREGALGRGRRAARHLAHERRRRRFVRCRQWNRRRQTPREGAGAGRAAHIHRHAVQRRHSRDRPTTCLAAEGGSRARADNRPPRRRRARERAGVPRSHRVRREGAGPGWRTARRRRRATRPCPGVPGTLPRAHGGLDRQRARASSTQHSDLAPRTCSPNASARTCAREMSIAVARPSSPTRSWKSWPCIGPTPPYRKKTSTSSSAKPCPARRGRSWTRSAAVARADVRHARQSPDE